MAWGWYLKILDELHVWKISDDAKRSPIFSIHVANPIFSGFTWKKPSNICIIMSQNLTWINVWKIHTFVSQMIQNSYSKSTIVQTTCNSSIQQFNRLSRDHFGAKQHWEQWKMKGTTKNVDFEWKACWSQTTLGTITSERNYAKCSFLSRKYLGAKQHWKLKQVKGTTQNDDFEQRALLSQATLGTIKRNHPLDFKWKTRWSQTTLWTIKNEGNHPKWRFWARSTLEPNNTGNSTITSEGNHPIFIIGQKCCSNTHVFPIWDNG